MGAKQAASLAGLAPVTRRSDKWRGKTFDLPPENALTLERDGVRWNHSLSF